MDSLARVWRIRWRWCALLLCCFVACAVAASASREQARPKACAANMRVLAGAIEMYNMDHSAPMRDVNPTTLAELVKASYLKCPLTPPSPGCSYSGRNLDKTTDMTQEIRCAEHGTVAELNVYFERLQHTQKMKQIIVVGTVAMALLIILGTIFWGSTSRRKPDEQTDGNAA